MKELDIDLVRISAALFAAVFSAGLNGLDLPSPFGRGFSQGGFAMTYPTRSIFKIADGIAGHTNGDACAAV